MNVFVREEKMFPYLTIYNSNMSINSYELEDKINYVLNQAICKIAGVQIWSVDLRDKSSWDICKSSDPGEPTGTLNISAGCSEWELFVAWAKNNAYVSHDIERADPVLFILDNPIGTENLFTYGACSGNFAAVGSNADLNTIVHEMLHMNAYGDLSDINDTYENAVDNIMFPTYPDPAGRTLKKVVGREVSTIEGKKEEQWKKLNKGF